MSISFYPSNRAGHYTGKFTYRLEACLCAQGIPNYGDYLDCDLTSEDEANLSMFANPECSWCGGCGVAREGHTMQEVNFGNATAHLLLKALDLSVPVGIVKIDVVREAFTRARRGIEDFVLRHEIYPKVEGNMIDMGVSAERLLESFERLQGLVDFCPPETTHLSWN